MAGVGNVLVDDMAILLRVVELAVQRDGTLKFADGL
jgi:hypothetical protein